MSRNLHLDPDSDALDYEEQKAAVEALGRGYRYVSVKSCHVEDIADAAEAVGIDPTRFRELMQVPDIDDYTTAPEEKNQMLRSPGEFSLSPAEVVELCEFVCEVLDAIGDAINVDATRERRDTVPKEEDEEDHIEEFVLTCLDARSTLLVMRKMCSVATEYDIGMEVI